MGNIFPRWTNLLPIKLIICLGALATVIAGLTWYTATPKFTRVGYAPQQPIPFDHALHAGQLKMDCRYCHSFVEDSPHSNIPAAQVCWNCHGPGKVKSDSPALAPLRQAMDPDADGYTGDPIRWVQIHETPDYAYFNHSAHVNRGVSCVECHGKVNEMSVVYHAKNLSMGFCLDCHRNVDEHLRPLDQITNLDWKAEDENVGEFYADILAQSGKGGKSEAEDNEAVAALMKADGIGEGDSLTQKIVGKHLQGLWNVHPPQDCAACHR